MRAATMIALAIKLSSYGQTLTAPERERAITELGSSRKLLLDTIAGLSENQWRFKPASDRWSVAECVEHIALTEDYYWTLIDGKLKTGAPEPARREEVKDKDDFVLKQMPDRSSKRITAPTLEPKGRWATPAAALAHFQQSRQRLVDYVRTTNDDLRDHFQAHRAVGLIDAYQWVLLASGHVRRHVQQIEEVKATPGYPKN